MIQDVGKVTPRARVLVYIKDVLSGEGAGNRMLVELVGFKSVTTSASMLGIGTATIQIPNFKGALIRFISKQSVDAMNAKQGKERVNEVCKWYFDQILRDPDSMFSTLWSDTVVNRGDKPSNISGWSSIIDPQVWSRSRAEIMGPNVVKGLLNQDDGLLYALPFIDVFDPIFVDYLGQDGFWYAGFTGLVTRVGDSYARTGQQSLTIQCKDYGCLLDNVSLVTAWNRPSTAEKTTDLFNFIFGSEANTQASQSPFDNIFADIDKIRTTVLEVVKRAQDMWTLPGTSAKYGLKSVAYDVTNVYRYDGMTARRWISEDAFGKEPDYFRGDRTLKENDYICPKLIMLDAALYDMDNLFIHKLIQSNLSLFKDSLKSGDQILNQIVSQMLAYKHMDGNGNLIIELPRYNAFPNFEQYGGRGAATVLRHEVRSIPNTKDVVNPSTGGTTESDTAKLDIVIVPKGVVNFGIISVKRGDALSYLFSDDYIPDDVDPASGEDISWYALKHHGVNYIMSPTDFVSFDTSWDEGTLITAVTMGALPPWLASLGSDIQNASAWYTGVASASVELLSKVGVRRFNASSLYNVNWGSNVNGARVLSHLSAVILERQNVQWDAGTIQLMQRPELQVNRTFLNPLRWKSYLIMGVTNSWSPGGRHSTTLNVSFGHPMHQTLEYPWTALRAEPKHFDVHNITAVSPDGTPVTENTPPPKIGTKAEKSTEK